jgi:hypothetical protein
MKDVEAQRPLTMDLWAGSFGEQKVTVSVNGSRIGTLELNGEPACHSLVFSSALLARDGTNAVEFQMPDASIPDNPQDPRLLGIQLLSLRIHVSP